MGIERKILSRLLGGASPSELIEEGYCKSTVYKVRNTIKTGSKEIISPPWSIKSISFDKDGSYKPGDAVRISFHLYNDSDDKDLYVKNIGIQTEWMKRDEWYRQEITRIMSCRADTSITMSFLVPKETAQGEHRMSFAMEGEFIKDEMPFMTQTSSTPIVIS